MKDFDERGDDGKHIVEQGTNGEHVVEQATNPPSECQLTNRATA
jgi:hypothetical protein